MRGRLYAQRRFGRAFAPVVVLLRVVTFLFALQFSGALHDVSDLVAAVADIEHAAEDPCPLDRPCDDCPSGCPNCHCPNLAGSLVAPSSFASVLEATAEALLPRALDGRAAPHGPDLPSLYRPPQSFARS